MVKHRQPARRAYASPLRASQRDATRRSIAAAAYALLQSSPDELTVPAIAARAGVSVPMVNRHFPSRQKLLEGVVAHIDAQGEGRAPSTDVDPELFFGAGLGPLVRDLFVRFSSMGIPAGGSASAAVMELRSKVTIPRRRRVTDEVIAKVLPELREPHRTWLSDLIVVLLSSAMVSTMGSYLGHSADENAKRMEWLLSTLFAEARRMSDASSTSPRVERGRGRGTGRSKLVVIKKGDRR